MFQRPPCCKHPVPFHIQDLSIKNPYCVLNYLVMHPGRGHQIMTNFGEKNPWNLVKILLFLRDARLVYFLVRLQTNARSSFKSNLRVRCDIIHNFTKSSVTFNVLAMLYICSYLLMDVHVLCVGMRGCAVKISTDQEVSIL
jgi:hypothetical protein